MTDLVKQERLEFFAGDCPLDEVEDHLSEEIHYTIKHYFRCKGCKKYFFIGACIRGKPIYKTMVYVNDLNFENILWGHYGTLYEKKKHDE